MTGTNERDEKLGKMGFDNLRVKNGFLDFDLPTPEAIRKNVSCPEPRTRRHYGNPATGSHHQPELEPFTDDSDTEQDARNSLPKEPAPVPELNAWSNVPEGIAMTTTPGGAPDWMPMTPEPLPTDSFLCAASAQTYYLSELDTTAYDDNVITVSHVPSFAALSAPSFFVPYVPSGYEQQEGSWTWPYHSQDERMSWACGQNDQREEWSRTWAQSDRHVERSSTWAQGDQHEGRSMIGIQSDQHVGRSNTWAHGDQHEGRSMIGIQSDQLVGRSMIGIQSDRHVGRSSTWAQGDQHEGRSMIGIQSDRHVGRSNTWAQGDQHEGRSMIGIQSDQHEGRSTTEARNTLYQIAPEVQAPPVSAAASSQLGAPAHHATRQEEPNMEERTYSKKLQCTYYIGIEDEPAFHVAKRILGPSGRYLKAITHTIRGTRLRLRGNGSKATPAAQDTGPMHLRLSAARYDTYCDAKTMVEAELNRIYREYFKFCGKVAQFRLMENPENDALVGMNG